MDGGRLGVLPRVQLCRIGSVCLGRLDHLSAQVLGTTPSDEFRPKVEADVDSYKVGSSPLWRLGKMAVGAYVPWRFEAGNPFDSGVPCKAFEAGLKVISNLAAR